MRPEITTKHTEYTKSNPGRDSLPDPHYFVCFVFFVV